MINKEILKILSRMDREIRGISSKISRIESKIDYTIGIIEVLFSEGIEEEDIDDYDTTETWVPDPDSWDEDEDE